MMTRRSAACRCVRTLSSVFKLNQTWRGGHQEGRNDGAVLLLASQKNPSSSAQKRDREGWKNALDSRGIILKRWKPSSLLFGIEINCL